MDLAKDHSTVTTIGGYAIIAVICGLWYYTTQTKSSRAQVVKSSNRADRDTATDNKRKTEKATKPKPKPKTPVADRSEPVASAVNYKDDVDVSDKKADLDFARQLANTHAGTKFNAKKSDDKRQKSVKQSKAQEITPNKTSTPSSTTGDADDDLSPQVSPVVTASDSQGVSDMLEPVAAGPSVLRLTDTDSVRKPKQQKAKAPEPVETKKQRQNRKKAEAAKAAREEEEKERKVKLEQQRRTARIAEGRPAKDGSTFVSTKNAWKSQSTSGDDSVPLLDTFEQKPKSESVKAPAAAPAPVAPATKAVPDAYSALPSEEEQLEMILQEDSWNEVKTKKKGKKKDAVTENQAPAAASVPSTERAAAPAKPVNGTKKPAVTSTNSSFAALTPEETADDDEPEEEWDV
ncbi:hypothetical protein GGS20DRAFT_134443 [Poronia punctata]|nr:hypothetical protein GGS20DRAFT_134443 [Poronia punctata]